jgi:hypothetical protein
MREDKAQITKKLEELINLTREGEVVLEYKKDYEIHDPLTFDVVGYYDEVVEIRTVDRDGNQYLVGAANVSCDSGIALIRDVLKHPQFN